MPAGAASILRTVLCGLGRIGYQYHLPSILGQPGLRLVGVVDPVPDRRREAAQAHAVPGFDDLASALAGRPDLVVLASPTCFHVEQALASFAAGADVFCDKPVATTVADFDAIAGAARRAGRRFLAYQPARFRPEVRALRGILASGRLGAVHLIRRARGSFDRRNDWQAFAANGGGMLNNYGSHCLDELVALGFGEVRSVFCQMRRIAAVGDAEDTVKAILTSEGGCLLDLDLSQASALPEEPWRVLGSRGAAVYEPAPKAWRLRYFLPEDSPPPEPQRDLAAAGRAYGAGPIAWRDETIAVGLEAEFDYYAAAAAHFLRAEPPPVTLLESRRVLELIERCRQSAASLRVA